MPLAYAPLTPTPAHKRIMQQGWRLAGHPTVPLDAPVNWDLAAKAKGGWGQRLVSLEPLDPLLMRYAETGDLKALDLGIGLVLDWWTTQAARDPAVDWSAAATGLRAWRISHLLEAVRVERVQRSRPHLVACLAEHERRLEDEATYASSAVAGLYQASGQLSIGLGSFRKLKTSAPLARQRLQQIIDEAFTSEGVYKQQAPEKHFLLYYGLQALKARSLLRTKPTLQRIDQIGQALGWFVGPGRRIASFGDSENRKLSAGDIDAPTIAAAGAQIFADAGYAILRTGRGAQSGYLAQTFGQPGAGAERADDLSVIWSARGLPLLIDPGRYDGADASATTAVRRKGTGRHDEARRRFLESVAAHNLPTIEGAADPDQAPSEGCGLLSWQEQDGVLVTLGRVTRDPHLHSRLMITDGAGWLVLVDGFFGDPAPQTTQWLHMAPEWTVKSSGAGFRAEYEAAAVRIDPLNSGEPVGPKLGVKPAEQGWWAPSADAFEPAPAIGFSRRSRLAAVGLSFADVGRTRAALELDGRLQGRLALTLGDGRRVEVRISDDRLSLDVRQTKTGKTMRRRAASPTIRWRSAGANKQYRITVRNEDTGESQVIYEGYRLQCRLPPELRLTSDQLSFRVANRDAEDPQATFAVSQPFTRIARFGDELQPDAPDVMRAPEVAGANAYRFLVREALSQDLLVDMAVDEPWALLPAGLIQGRQVVWSMRPRLGETWRNTRWSPVSEEAVAAARRRAETLIVISAVARERPDAEAVTWAAPRVLDLPAAPARDPALAIAVAVSARPELAPHPSPASVIETQWSNGQGAGAAERVAQMLEAVGQRGWFFLDVELGDALDPDAVGRLARRLTEKGHDIGLYIGAGVLAPSQSVAERLQAMLAGVPTRAHTGVMLGAGPDREAWLQACVDASLPAVVVSRAAQLSLPGWMRWRSAAFAASPSTVVLPTAMFLSTPAHARDRVTRHALDNQDAMAAATIGPLIGGMATLEATRLVLAEIDPLLLMDRRLVANADAAHAWNSTLKQALPAWFASGWKRSVKEYEMAADLSEIRLHLLSGMLEGLAGIDMPRARWSEVFDPGATAGWLPEGVAFEPVIELRRGPRRMRRSALRRYDDAYRLALGVRS